MFKRMFRNTFKGVEDDNNIYVYFGTMIISISIISLVLIIPQGFIATFYAFGILDEAFFMSIWFGVNWSLCVILCSLFGIVIGNLLSEMGKYDR